jgi:hypothetical protein
LPNCFANTWPAGTHLVCPPTVGRHPDPSPAYCCHRRPCARTRARLAKPTMVARPLGPHPPLVAARPPERPRRAPRA